MSGLWCWVVAYHSTLSETNRSHLKMNGWNTSFLLGPGLFSGAKMLVSGSVPFPEVKG